MQRIKNILLKALPFVIIVFLFMQSTLLGFLGIITYFLYLMYNSKGSLIYIYAGNQASKKKDYKQAKKALSFAYDKGWLKPQHEISYAYLLMKRFKETEKAKKIINRTLSIPGINNDTVYLGKLNYALANFIDEEYDEAIDLIEKVKPKYTTTNLYGTLGYLYILKNDLDKALEVNLEAYEYNESNNVIRDNLGQTYLLLGQYDKAEEIYEKLMQEKPKFPEAYYNYGLLKKNLGDYDEAIYQMDKALEKEFTYLTVVSKEDIENEIDELFRLREEKLNSNKEGDKK